MKKSELKNRSMHKTTMEMLQSGDVIGIVWHTDDVKYAAPKLTKKQARDVLAFFEDHHDSYELWQQLEAAVEELYPGSVIPESEREW